MLCLTFADRLSKLDDQLESAFEIDGETKLNNNSGLCLRILVDLQKIIGCAQVQGHTTPQRFTPKEKANLKIQANANHLYSSRINLAFRSNTFLRTAVWP